MTNPSLVIEADFPMPQDMAREVADYLQQWDAEGRTGPIVLAEGLRLTHIAADGTIEPRIVHMPDALAVRLVTVLGFLGMAFAFAAGLLIGGAT